MYTITASAPDFALEAGLWYLKTSGVVCESRNGRVLRAPGPVCTVWADPRQRVSFSPLRDANPFFHLFEAIWMLAGRNDAASLLPYNSHMATFAEGGQFWGAYGNRWRKFFGFDQLTHIIERLKVNPSDRRLVLSMWAPNGDLIPAGGLRGGASSKDVPCNTAVYFDASLGKLDMTVTNRSNDIVWGAYGANVVHMSFLHEFVAAAAGVPLGTYYQFSNNYHAYIDRPDVQKLIDTQRDRSSWSVNFQPGNRLRTSSHTLMGQGEDYVSFLVDAETFLEADEDWAPATAFFRSVAVPLKQAHAAWREGDYGGALSRCRDCQSEDWRYAAVEWLCRRLRARGAKGDEAATQAVSQIPNVFGG